MATRRQEIAAKVVVSGGTPTEGMRVANYSPYAIRKPKVLTASKGYKETLAKYGLTEKFITVALVEDIKSKPTKRVQELSLGAEILGMKKQEDKPPGNVANVIQIIINPPHANNVGDQPDRKTVPSVVSSQ